MWRWLLEMVVVAVAEYCYFTLFLANMDKNEGKHAICIFWNDIKTGIWEHIFMIRANQYVSYETWLYLLVFHFLLCRMNEIRWNKNLSNWKNILLGHMMSLSHFEKECDSTHVVPWSMRPVAATTIKLHCCVLINMLTASRNMMTIPHCMTMLVSPIRKQHLVCSAFNF